MSLPAHMKGSAEFYPHGYIHGWAEHLLDDVQSIQQGQANYYRIAALLAVMSFEAYINYIGERGLKKEEWKEHSPWKTKLKLLLKTFNASTALEKEPFSLLDELFDYRNKFAHGKILCVPLDYIDHGGGMLTGEHRGDPQWYKDFGDAKKATASLQTIKNCMIALRDLAEPEDAQRPWTIRGNGSAAEVHGD